jgi:hypothetical protein
MGEFESRVRKEDFSHYCIHELLHRNLTPDPNNPCLLPYAVLFPPNPRILSTLGHWPSMATENATS